MLVKLLEDRSKSNCYAAWTRLFAFALHVFRLPDFKAERTDSLMSVIKEQLFSYNKPVRFHVSNNRSVGNKCLRKERWWTESKSA